MSLQEVFGQLISSAAKGIEFNLELNAIVSLFASHNLEGARRRMLIYMRGLSDTHLNAFSKFIFTACDRRVEAGELNPLTAAMICGLRDECLGTIGKE